MTSSPWDFLTGVAENDRRNVAMVLESVQDLYAPSELEDLTRQCVERALLVTDAQRGLLLLAGEEGKLEVDVALDKDGRALPQDLLYSRSVVAEVWATGESQQAVALKREDLTLSMDKSGLLSVMAVPLVVKGRSLGVLYVDSTKTVKTFGDSELAVFRALGGLVALAVENARLLEEKAEQERIERELAVARRIQQQLFPKSMPQPPGFQLAAVGRPCKEVSGDYYDAIDVPGGELALIVGDVSDHGLGPALLMASTRASLHNSFEHPDVDHVRMIEGVNRFLERDTPDGMFMSLFLGLLEPETRRLRYVNAGHCPPLLGRADGTILELPRTGLILGVDPTSRYTLGGPLTLESGDVLMCYTDGLYEAHDAERMMYGEDRLRASFARHAAASEAAPEILQSILGDVRSFIDGAPLEDDVTLMVLRTV